MSERLPSGSTTSNSRTPRRFMAPITCNERPSNGCRSRRIVTKLDMSRRWAVCDGFLRQHRVGVVARGSPSPDGLSLRAALLYIERCLEAPVQQGGGSGV